MSPKVALMLRELEWMLMCMARPTFGNLSSTFESWAHRSGQLRQIHRLEAEEFIRTRGRSLDRVIELTEKGRSLLAGPRDPERCWAEPWDGIWRVVVFDVPEKNRRLRDKLRDALKVAYFGQLQKSVWISPRPVPDLQRVIKRHAGGSQRMTVMECRVVPGSEEREVARVAWDFRKINSLYMQHTDI
jgi:phenylacetic acid degradation operon negative regulatory protein